MSADLACARLDKLVPGQSWVKVEYGGERFWCSVHEAGDGTVTVVVDNDLIGNHGIRRGDRLVIQYGRVLEVADVADMRDYLQCVNACGCGVDGALVWRQQRIGEGRSVEFQGPLIVGNMRVR